MATADPRYGRVRRGDILPYGTLANANQALIDAYYRHGVRDDEDWPELPVWEPDAEVVDPIAVIHKQEIATIVAILFEGMPPREVKVLCMRFGIGLSQDYTLEDVGNTYGLTRERVRQIEKKAMRRFKHPDRLPIVRQMVDFESPYFKRSY